MTDSVTERYIRAERTISNLIERLPKEQLGQVTRMLAQNIAHYRLQTGAEIPIAQTLVLFNSPTLAGIDTETRRVLSAEALEELAAILSWQAGETLAPPGPKQAH